MLGVVLTDAQFEKSSKSIITVFGLNTVPISGMRIDVSPGEANVILPE